MKIPSIFGNPFSRMTLGLEIGSSSVKAVWVLPVSGGWKIVDFVIEELDRETWDISGPLSRIARKVKVPCRQMVAVFSGEGIYEGASILPPMPEKEMANFLRMTLIDKGSLDLSDPVIKFIVSRVKPVGKKRAVMTLAADSPVWKKLLNQVSRSRISLTSLVFGGTAYENFIPPSVDNLLLVDIGARKKLFYFYRDGALVFIRREEMLGADDLTRDMTMEMVTPEGTVRLNPEQAEEIKRQFGIPGHEQMEDKAGGIVLNEIWPMLRPWCDRLVTAVKDSMIFYQQHFGPDRIKVVYLTGGGALLLHLRDYLADNCGREVALLPAPDNLTWASETLRDEFAQSAPRLQSALGAALETGAKPNLLPFKNIISRKLLRPLRVLWIILPFFAIALGVLGLATGKQVRLSTIREEQLGRVLSSRQAAAEEWRRVFSKEREIIQARQFIRRAQRHPDLWIGAFWEISRLLPDRIILNWLTMKHTGEEGLLTIEGRVVIGDREDPDRDRPEQILTSFTGRLMESPFFSDARNLEAGEDESGLFRFTFTVLLQRWEDG
jgi:Tfp pilus assembly PilM family ATPase